MPLGRRRDPLASLRDNPRLQPPPASPRVGQVGQNLAWDIVEALGSKNERATVYEDEHGLGLQCVFCSLVEFPGPMGRKPEHEETCLWRRAQVLVQCRAGQ